MFHQKNQSPVCWFEPQLTAQGVRRICCLMDTEAPASAHTERLGLKTSRDRDDGPRGGRGGGGVEGEKERKTIISTQIIIKMTPAQKQANNLLLDEV